MVSIVQELKDLKHHTFRLTASATFTLAVMAVIVAAIVSARDWPAQAKVVPLTAAGLALAAAALNLVNELFGKQTLVALGASADGGYATGGIESGLSPQVIRWRATSFFGWIAALFGLVFLIGFIPAIAVFVFAYMAFGFGEPPLPSLGYAAATTLLCWVVFHWALGVAWPQSLLGDLLPAWRASTGLI